MSLFSPFHETLVRTLLKNEVNFVIIGGFAAIYYGVSRGTGDLDLLIEPSQENGQRLLNAFRELQLDIGDLQPKEFEKPLFLAFGFEPNAVDVSTFTPAVNYLQARESSQFFTIGNDRVPVIGIELLIENKKNLNRPGPKGLLDEYDVQELTRIKNKLE
ncbi:MAG TPA: hypothetical protein PKC10_04360 [Cyclobacteriaceae bacterium]|nr:hypothetical protein [Cyclobacteriaceae bacterium]